MTSKIIKYEGVMQDQFMTRNKRYKRMYYLSATKPHLALY